MKKIIVLLVVMFVMLFTFINAYAAKTPPNYGPKAAAFMMAENINPSVFKKADDFLKLKYAEYFCSDTRWLATAQGFCKHMYYNYFMTLRWDGSFAVGYTGTFWGLTVVEEGDWLKWLGK